MSGNLYGTAPSLTGAQTEPATPGYPFVHKSPGVAGPIDDNPSDPVQYSSGIVQHSPGAVQATAGVLAERTASEEIGIEAVSKFTSIRGGKRASPGDPRTPLGTATLDPMGGTTPRLPASGYVIDSTFPKGPTGPRSPWAAMQDAGPRSPGDLSGDQYTESAAYSSSLVSAVRPVSAGVVEGAHDSEVPRGSRSSWSRLAVGQSPIVPDLLLPSPEHVSPSRDLGPEVSFSGELREAGPSLLSTGADLLQISGEAGAGGTRGGSGRRGPYRIFETPSLFDTDPAGAAGSGGAAGIAGESGSLRHTSNNLLTIQSFPMLPEVSPRAADAASGPDEGTAQHAFAGPQGAGGVPQMMRKPPSMGTLSEAGGVSARSTFASDMAVSGVGPVERDFHAGGSIGRSPFWDRAYLGGQAVSGGPAAEVRGAPSRLSLRLRREEEYTDWERSGRGRWDARWNGVMGRSVEGDDRTRKGVKNGECGFNRREGGLSACGGGSNCGRFGGFEMRVVRRDGVFESCEEEEEKVLHGEEVSHGEEGKVESCICNIGGFRQNESCKCNIGGFRQGEGSRGTW